MPVPKIELHNVNRRLQRSRGNFGCKLYLYISSICNSIIFAKNNVAMNLHEYQAKELLKKYNVPVQEGIAVDTVMAAEEAYRQIKNQTGTNFAVVKAQIHAGGRGKGTIKGRDQRGVAVGKSLEDIVNITKNIL